MHLCMQSNREEVARSCEGIDDITDPQTEKSDNLYFCHFSQSEGQCRYLFLGINTGNRDSPSTFRSWKMAGDLKAKCDYLKIVKTSVTSTSEHVSSHFDF